MASPPPYSAQDMSATVDVIVFKGSKNGSVDAKATLRGLPRPVKFEDVAAELVRQGFDKPKALIYSSPECFVEVTDGPSGRTGDEHWQINIDQPLLHFYNKVFLPAGAGGALETPPPYDTSEARLAHDGRIAQVNGVNIRFHRTIRVPDNDKTHALPPDMGPFQLFNVGSATDTLPKSVLDKGGAFLSMYQREAMWMSFNSASPKESYAVKISVGGVNALTGVPQDARSCGRQDYLPVGGEAGQLWLDGISTAPGVVRQFVAMPLGKGYTVEGQVTGAEDEGGIQIDVYPRYATSVEFECGGSPLDLYESPRQLGMSTGFMIKMCPKSEDVVLLEGRGSVNPSSLTVELTARYTSAGSHSVLINVKTTNGDAFVVDCEKSDTIEHLKTKIEDLQGISSQFQRLIHAGKQLRVGLTISDYGIQSEATVYLFLRMVGGGPGPEIQDMLAGFAAGGKISQKINRDPLPTTAYDESKVQTFHVAVINAACFTAVTGLPSPSSPITAQTYLKYDLPWFELYDEHIPAANNALAPTPLGDVKSIAQLDRDRAAAGGKDDLVQTPCARCMRELATHRLSPCGHVFCNACSRTLAACPSCDAAITGRKRFAAAMLAPGMEDADGVDALSLDDRIVKLRRGARSDRVITFRLGRCAVSGLSGAERSAR